MKKRYALVLVSFLILAALLAFSDPGKVYEIFSGSDKAFLLYAFLVSNVTVLLRVLKWKVILGAPMGDVLPVQLLGLTISNFTPGKIGEPTKSLLMKMKTGMPVSKSLSSIIWERILDVTVLILLSLVFLRSFSSSLFLLEVTGIIFFVVVIAVSLLVVYKRSVGIRIFKVFGKLPLLRRISPEFLDNFYGQKIGIGNLVLSFLITMLTWVLDGFVFYLAFRSIGVGIGPVFFIGLFAVSTLMGVMSFLPGGLGSTEAVMIFLLSLSVQTSVAVAGVFIARIITFWYFVFLGSLSFLYLSKHFGLRKIFD